MESIAARGCRSFDLGGSGLRTMTYEEKGGRIKQTSENIFLGRINIDKSSGSSWIREALASKASSDLDVEIRSGFVFGFCLAGYDKLFESGLKPIPVEWRDEDVPLEETREKIGDLFNIPSSQVCLLHDAEAHLMGSRFHFFPTPFFQSPKNSAPIVSTKPSLDLRFPIMQFTIGTGMGFACTNSKGFIRPISHIKHNFNGTSPWDLSSHSKSASEKKAYFAMSSLGLKELEEFHKSGVIGPGEIPLLKFHSRWMTFLEEEIFRLYKEKNLTLPVYIFITGGVVDSNREESNRRKNLFPFPSTEMIKSCQEKGIPIVIPGPMNAGILGAAIYAFGILFPGFDDVKKEETKREQAKGDVDVEMEGAAK